MHMRLGKLTNEQLERLILNKYTSTRKELYHLPRVGDDCAILDMGGDLVALSTDPITSAAGHIGALSVHINCNDAAAAGAEPVGLLVTLLAPPHATEEEIGKIADELAETAKRVGVDILGGHTEVTDSVTRFITSTTVIARLRREALLTGMKAGDDIVLTKWAGLEGSAVLASDFAHKLTGLSEEQLAKLRGLIDHISVVKEGTYAAAHGATAMHDVTEGGIYGAAWEMCFAAKTGMTLDQGAIPVLPETALACRILELDPMRLISSGCMLIACKNGAAMAAGIRAMGIEASVIGKAGGEGLRLADGTLIQPPEADELYKLSPEKN